jgi:hypothetical protein
VWHHFGERFDQLNVTVHGQGQTLHQSFSYDQMRSLFGPRSPSMDSTTLSSALTRLGLGVIIGFVALVGLVVVAVLVTRGRRRRTTGAPGGQPWGGAPPAWSPGGPGPPGPAQGPGWGPGTAWNQPPGGPGAPGWGPAPGWVAAPQAPTPSSAPPLWPAPRDPPRNEPGGPSPGAGAPAEPDGSP